MNSFDRLIEALNENETIKTFKKLEQLVRENETYLNAYKEITALQKRMVQANHYQSKDKTLHEKRYLDKLEALERMPVVHQYLEYLDIVNSEMQLLFSIIEEELNENSEEKLD